MIFGREYTTTSKLASFFIDNIDNRAAGVQVVRELPLQYEGCGFKSQDSR